jgi:hypothetical protein
VPREWIFSFIRGSANHPHQAMAAGGQLAAALRAAVRLRFGSRASGTRYKEVTNSTSPEVLKVKSEFGKILEAHPAFPSRSG